MDKQVTFKCPDCSAQTTLESAGLVQCSSCESKHLVDDTGRLCFLYGVCGEPLKANLPPSDLVDWQTGKRKQISGDRKQVFGGDNLKIVTEPSSKPAPISLLYTSNKELRCVFFSLVVRNAALDEKYQGGATAFAQKHDGEMNQHLTVVFSMGTEGINDAANDLLADGFEGSEDFICFDATSEYLIPAAYDEKAAGKEIRFNVEWVRGFVRGGYVWVYYTGVEKP
jgi:DNA-directed RNA polymerase subunit RPC12/RpoP